MAAIVVDNPVQLSFGTFSADTTVTHFKATLVADSSVILLQSYSSPQTIRANQSSVVGVGLFQIKYEVGELPNSHIMKVVESFWGEAGSRISIRLDLMTSLTEVVTDSGYTPITTNNLRIRLVA